MQLVIFKFYYQNLSFFKLFIMKHFFCLIWTFTFYNLSAQVGIGTINPNNTLEINSAVSNNSGLRFTQLNSNSVKTNLNNNALAVNNLGDVVVIENFPKVSSSISAGINASTPNDTTVILGEIMFRSDKTTIGNSGNINIRSSSNANIVVTMSSHDVFSPAHIPCYVFPSTTLDTNVGSWTGFFAGNTDRDEYSIFYVSTATGGFYRITISNRADLSISVIGEQLR